MTTDDVTTPARTTAPAIVTPAPDDPPAQRPRSLSEGTDDDNLEYILNNNSLDELEKALATKNKVGTALLQTFDGEAAGDHPQDLVEATAASLALPPSADRQDSVDDVQCDIANADPPSLTIEQRRAALRERKNAATIDRHADLRELFKAKAARGGPQEQVGALRAFDEAFIADLMDRITSDDESKSASAGVVVRYIINGDFHVLRSLILGPIVQDITKRGCAPEILRKRIAELCSILSIKPNPPARKVAESGVVPSLVRLLQPHDDLGIRLLAMEAVSTIAKLVPDKVYDVVREGGITKFIQLLDSHNIDVVASAASGLDSIAGRGPHVANLVLSKGAMKPLLKIVQSLSMDSEQSVRLVRVAASALSTLCSGKFDVVRPAVLALAHLLKTQLDEGIVAAACRGLAHFATGPDGTTQAVVDAGVCPRLVELLRDTTSPAAVQAAASLAAANILAGTHAQAKAILDEDPPPFLVKFLKSRDSAVREVACWAIANSLRWGDQAQVQKLKDFVPALFGLLASSKFSTRMAALQAIFTFTIIATPDQIHAVIDTGCIPSLTRVLTWDVAEREGIHLALLTFRNIVEAGMWHFQPGDDGSLARAYGKGLRIQSATAGLRNELWDVERQLLWYADEGIRSLARDVRARSRMLFELYFARYMEGAGWRSSKRRTGSGISQQDH